MWDWALPLLLAPGSGLLYLVYRYHVDAVSAERRRADDWRQTATEWREAYRTSEERGDVRDRQMGEVLVAMKAVRPT